MINQTLGHFHVLEKLGSGGMGEVFKAEDLKLRRHIALKLLSGELASSSMARERFTREARAIASLNHPNICTIFEVGEDQGRHFLVLELLEGETLADYLRRLPKSDFPQVLEWATQLTDGLNTAHKQGVLHRDLKPANIFVTRRGILKILDFGLAKGLTRRGVMPDEPTVSLEPATSPGAAVGTVMYMSPEQVRGEALDERSDLFALGLVLYELSCGRRAFEGTSQGLIYDSILHHDPAPLHNLPEWPERWGELISMLLEKDRGLRCQTAGEVLAHLHRLQRNLRATPTESYASPVLASISTKGTASETGNRKSSSTSDPSTGALAVSGKRAGKNIQSLLILPFENVSSNPEMYYLAEGLPESLMFSLSEIPNLQVFPRDIAFRFRDRLADPLTCARELQARAVLSGRLQEIGQQLRITVYLTDLAAERQLWGGQFVRAASDLLAVQEEIAQEIVAKLRPQLAGAKGKKALRKTTQDNEAYQLSLRARHLMFQGNPDDINQALNSARQAVQRDPDFALAHAVLAMIYTWRIWPGGYDAPSDVAEVARRSAQMALRLDPNIVEAYCALGYLQIIYDWDWQAGEANFARALAINPNFSFLHALQGLCALYQGRWEESKWEMHEAYNLDPTSPLNHLLLGVYYIYHGETELALPWLRKGIEQNPGLIWPYEYNALALSLLGRHAEALDSIDHALAMYALPRHIMLRAILLMRAGRKAEAAEIIQQRLKTGKLDCWSEYFVAQYWAYNAEPEKSLDALERAMQDHSPFMIALGQSRLWNDLHIRSHPRFQAILDRVGLADSVSAGKL